MRSFHRNAHPQRFFAKALYGGATDFAFILQFGDGRRTVFGEPVIAGGERAERAAFEVGVAAFELVETGLLGALADNQ